MRVLVTGATGKVGNAVARMLVERGDEVVALVRDPGRAAHVLHDGVEPIAGDVTDPASCARAAEGAEGVFNCMGIYEQWLGDPGVFDRVNAYGAANVVDAAAAAGARRVVHTSTIDVFACANGGTVRETQLATQPKGTAYERSKQLAERLVLERAGDRIEVVLANPGGVYGPGPWAKYGFDSMVRDAIRKRLPAVPPGGSALAYVEDVAAAHLAAFDRGRPGERYLLAGEFASPKEICVAAIAHAGRGRAPAELPYRLAQALAGGGEALSRVIKRPPILGRGQLHYLHWSAHADSSKAKAELGFDPVPLHDGVKHWIDWMKAAGRI